METYQCPFFKGKFAVYHPKEDIYTVTCECGSVRLPADAWKVFRRKYCQSVTGWKQCSTAAALLKWYEK